ncbi:CPBP family intramembrane glutamic endopeptidase [Streptococcus cristatus]|jgi:CAAX amino terminal protease family protein, putative|uniref:CPBP family intramembrane glutamic endopeptidase n=1 Tax=Streptococcus cristatus TaxID=45634 RepID=UPI0011F0F720|nr:type II CAAX endopeptidase family protein [Streptococcus cristatus]
MKIFLQKVEYSLLALFLAVQTQVPFVLIQFYKGRDQSFSMGYTLLILMIYLLIIFYALRMAKKEGLLTLDFSFFNLKSVIWLVLSYLITFGVSIFAAIIMVLEGQLSGTTANQAALQNLFQSTPVVLLIVGAVFSAPILEEIIFRGLIPQKLFPKHELIGLIVGSILFGFFHGPTNIGSFVLYAGMGGVLALVVHQTKRLEMGILAHMLRNAIAILVMIISQS